MDAQHVTAEIVEPHGRLISAEQFGDISLSVHAGTQEAPGAADAVTVRLLAHLDRAIDDFVSRVAS